MIQHTPPLPNASSDAYLWYMQGAADQEAAQWDEISTGAKEVIEFLMAIARLGGITATPKRLLILMCRQYCPKLLRWRFRHE